MADYNPKNLKGRKMKYHRVVAGVATLAAALSVAACGSSTHRQPVVKGRAAMAAQNAQFMHDTGQDCPVLWVKNPPKDPFPELASGNTWPPYNGPRTIEDCMAKWLYTQGARPSEISCTPFNDGYNFQCSASLTDGGNWKWLVAVGNPEGGGTPAGPPPGSSIFISQSNGAL